MKKLFFSTGILGYFLAILFSGVIAVSAASLTYDPPLQHITGTAGQTLPASITVSNLTPGATYTLVTDGIGGSQIPDAWFFPTSFTASLSTDIFNFDLNIPANATLGTDVYSVKLKFSSNGSGGLGAGCDIYLSVNPAKVTPIVTVTVGSYTYTGSPQGPDAYTTAPTGDTGAATWSYVGTGSTTYGPSATKPTAAGTYTATVSLAADANFNAASSSATTFTIAKAAPVVTVTVGIYTYTGSPQGPNAYTTAPTGDTGAATWSYVGTGTTVYPASATKPTAAGTYTATVSLAADANFNAATSSATAFTITAKAASVTPNAASKVYGAADPVFTGTLTGFLTADNVTAVYSRVAGETVLGSPYAISAVLSPAGVLTNYTITYNTANFTITAKAASVVTVTVGNYTYTGSPQGPDAFTTVPTGDTGAATWSYVGTGSTTYPASATKPTLAGTYTATVSLAADANFNAASSSATAFTIAKRPLIVSANPRTKVFGSVDPSLTYQITSGALVSGDIFTGALTRSPGEAVGTYSITQGTLTAGNNYLVTFVGSTFTITAPVFIPVIPPPPPPPTPAVPMFTVDFQGAITQGPMTNDGRLAQTLIAPSLDGKNSISIPAGTQVTDAQGNVLNHLELRITDNPGTALNTQLITIYVITPNGSKFDKPVSLELGYEVNALPPNTDTVELDQYLQAWLKLQANSNVVSGVGELTTNINNSGIYAVLGNLIPPANFQLNSLSVTRSITKYWSPIVFFIKYGDDTTLRFNLSNTGGLSGTYTALLTLNGKTIATQQVTLNGGKSQIITFNAPGNLPGTYRVQIGNLTGQFVSGLWINWWLISGLVAGLILAAWALWYFKLRKPQLS